MLTSAVGWIVPPEPCGVFFSVAHAKRVAAGFERPTRKEVLNLDFEECPGQKIQQTPANQQNAEVRTSNAMYYTARKRARFFSISD
jgi:hypothetical protein